MRVVLLFVLSVALPVLVFSLELMLQGDVTEVVDPPNDSTADCLDAVLVALGNFAVEEIQESPDGDQVFLLGSHDSLEESEDRFQDLGGVHRAEPAEDVLDVVPGFFGDHSLCHIASIINLIID